MNVNSSSNRGEAILAALKTQFPGAVLDEERQTPEQDADEETDGTME